MKYDPSVRRAYLASVVVTGIAVAIVACGSFDADDETPSPSPSPDGSVAEDAPPPLPDGAPPDAGHLEAGPCPTGFGPDMVVVRVSSQRSICIDKTEVSSAHYAQFRATVSDVTSLQQLVPSGCEALAAAALDSADDAGAFPRRQVSFCSAAFFCAAQGKRLCGSLADGSGAVKTTDGGPSDDPSLEWEGACAQGKEGAFYPWGTTDPDSAGPAGCLTATTAPDASGPRPVATGPVCGPTPGPYDMIGNVWEWVNLRVDLVPANVSYSAVRGGAFASETVVRGCATVHGIDAPLGARAAGQPDVGFRCCADPKP